MNEEVASALINSLILSLNAEGDDPIRLLDKVCHESDTLRGILVAEILKELDGTTLEATKIRLIEALNQIANSEGLRANYRKILKNVIERELSKGQASEAVLASAIGGFANMGEEAKNFTPLVLQALSKTKSPMVHLAGAMALWSIAQPEPE